MEVEILSTTGSKVIGRIRVSANATVQDVKNEIYNIKKTLYPDRQSIRLEAKGKSLKDEDSLKSLNISQDSKLYVKDLGPQVAWKTVFLVEYAGPLFVYLWVYQRPSLIYGVSSAPMDMTVHVAAACWSFHYAKRLLETLFVHRFSHGTMPIRNILKNCSYYWLFTLYVAYHINHPLYTSPGKTNMYIGLAGFILSELGNLSIHLALRDLRPHGTKVRRIPLPTSNPFTKLFSLVSCPNYTYEFASWAFFTYMTKCLPVGVFAIAGLYQMTMWALGKHRTYKKEFSCYPTGRYAILPFVL